MYHMYHLHCITYSFASSFTMVLAMFANNNVSGRVAQVMPTMEAVAIMDIDRSVHHQVPQPRPVLVQPVQPVQPSVVIPTPGVNIEEMPEEEVVVTPRPRLRRSTRMGEQRVPPVAPPWQQPPQPPPLQESEAEAADISEPEAETIVVAMATHGAAPPSLVGSSTDPVLPSTGAEVIVILDNTSQ